MQLKLCTICKTEKPINDFYPRKDKSDGLRTDCKECTKRRTKKNYFANLEQRRLAHKNDYHKRRRFLLIKAQYNITEKQFKEMTKKQNGKCLICGGVMKWNLHIDHNHKTGKVRGLLCDKCNMGLGCFRDRIDLLKTAIEYLQKND